MELIILIASFSALLLCIASLAWILAKQNRRLDRLYHDALHAESTGKYADATKLYQSILDQSGSVLVIGKSIRLLVKHRMKTLRHEQDWLGQFLTPGKLAEYPPSMK